VPSAQTPAVGELLSSLEEVHAGPCLQCGTQAKFKLSMQRSVSFREEEIDAAILAA
jgi:hypothetical protein